jgi:hypothetical protein
MVHVGLELKFERFPYPQELFQKKLSPKLKQEVFSM